MGVWSEFIKPVFAQALVPYRVNLNSQQLEQTGLSLVEEAIQLARFQQFPLALARAKLAVELAPKQAGTWALLGSLYLQEQKLEEGIAALETALKLAPSRPDLRFILGRARFQKQEYKEAVEQFRAAKIDAFFNLMFEQKASDLHLASGNPPMLRINGEILRVDYPPLENDSLKTMLYEIAPDFKIKLFEETGDVDFGYEIPNISRFRANFFQQKNGVSAVFRQIPSKVLSFEDFEKFDAPLPVVLKKFCMLHRGLVKLNLYSERKN